MRIRPQKLLLYPRVTLRRLQRSDGGATQADVHIDGLVCDMCAARAQRALAGLPGVTAAEVDLECGAASVTFAGPAASEQAMARAVEGVVLLRPARRWLARLSAIAARRRGVRKADSRRTSST